MHPPTSLAEDWGAISRKRCMIRSWCQQMTYRKPLKLHALTTGEVTFDTTWLKSQRLLWPRTVGLSAQAQSLLLCPALSYSALSWWGHHEKVGGTVKKFFRRQAPEFVPPLLKCFRRHWKRSCNLSSSVHHIISRKHNRQHVRNC